MCSFVHINTTRVYKSTPCVDTCRVQSSAMDTIGDRIRKARLARGWSGAELAKRAGYKTQSGISNLENRSTGSGGHKVAHIAKVLHVPLDWLLNGSDTEDVPLLSFYDTTPFEPLVARESTPTVLQFQNSEDARTVRLLKLWSALDNAAKNELLDRVEFYVAGRVPHQNGQALSVANKQ